jgi:hypothetical protein
MYGIELISPHRHNRQKTEHKIKDACDGTADLGRLEDRLPGCRTSVGWSSGTNDTPRTLLGCFTSHALSSRALFHNAFSNFRAPDEPERSVFGKPGWFDRLDNNLPYRLFVE